MLIAGRTGAFCGGESAAAGSISKAIVLENQISTGGSSGKPGRVLVPSTSMDEVADFCPISSRATNERLGDTDEPPPIWMKGKKRVGPDCDRSKPTIA